MKWFKDPQEEKLKQLLRESRQDFNYDHESLRMKVLQNLERREEVRIKPRMWVVTKYALVAVCFVFLFSATFAFTSNAQPGEKLFTLNKWGEQVILSLPLPEEQKLNIETNIVTKRFEALDNVEKETNILETVRESDESLGAVVEKIITNKEKVKSDVKKIEKFDRALERLEAEASLREQKIKDLEDRTSNQEDKAKIRAHRENFQKIRAKVDLEVRAIKAKRQKLELENSQD